MKTTFQTATRLSVIALAIALISGCASTGSVSDLEAQLEAAQQEAAAAKSAADAANAKADEARQMASGAQSTANQALNAANQAQASSDATNEKIDRMFQRSQSK